MNTNMYVWNGYKVIIVPEHEYEKLFMEYSGMISYEPAYSNEFLRNFGIYSFKPGVGSNFDGIESIDEVPPEFRAQLLLLGLT